MKATTTTKGKAKVEKAIHSDLKAAKPADTIGSNESRGRNKKKGR
ncbi:hypothetical protein [Bryobacter aggregatus]|nr:hypothetical protein [Bryobacter aggregatus]